MTTGYLKETKYLLIVIDKPLGRAIKSTGIKYQQYLDEKKKDHKFDV